MAQGLLSDFQPQGLGYGNILMDEPVQYGLDEGFGALAGSLRNVIIDPVLGTLSDVGSVMGDIRSGRPVGMSRLQDVSQRAAMDLTGTGRSPDYLPEWRQVKLVRLCLAWLAAD